MSTRLEISRFGQAGAGGQCRNASLPGPAARLFALVLLFLVGFGAIALAQQAGPNANLREWLGVDVIELLKTADPLGKISLVVLALFSIVSWMVIVYKFLHIRQALIQTDEFVELCNQGSGELDEAFRVAAKFPDSPLAQILREGYLELEIENWYRYGREEDTAARVEMAKVGIERVFERTINNEISHLESKLIILATTTNVCPFIGLFGTVWGIMGGFQAISEMGMGVASISSLAPSISTALLCTVGGLFCAIPASVTYNYFTHRVQYLISRMDAFALELSNVIHKQILKQALSGQPSLR